MDLPHISHWNAMIYVPKYLKVGVFYIKIQAFTCHGYIDANQATSPLDKISITKYYMFIDGNLVSWKELEATYDNKII